MDKLVWQGFLTWLLFESEITISRLTNIGAAGQTSPNSVSPSVVAVSKFSCRWVHWCNNSIKFAIARWFLKWQELLRSKALCCCLLSHACIVGISSSHRHRMRLWGSNGTNLKKSSTRNSNLHIGVNIRKPLNYSFWQRNPSRKKARHFWNNGRVYHYKCNTYTDSTASLLHDFKKADDCTEVCECWVDNKRNTMSIMRQVSFTLLMNCCPDSNPT